MGREEKRQRQRTIRQLKRRLGREPTEQEVDQALDVLRQTQEKLSGTGPGRLSRR